VERIDRITDSDFYGGEPVYMDHASRYASRGVLVNNDSNVAMMYMARHNLYKLPGGGIEAGESAAEAFLREVKEETGFESEIIHELGIIEEHKNRNQFMQRSYCFIAKTSGRSSSASLSESEHELGMSLRWMSIEEAIQEMSGAAANCKEYSFRFMLLRDGFILRRAAAMLNDVGYR